MAIVFKTIYYTHHELWDNFNLVAENGDKVFHCSVRANPKRIVFNALIGGVWGQEHKVPFDFGGVPMHILTVTVHETTAYLLVDGVVLHRCDLVRPLDDSFTVQTTMPWMQAKSILSGGAVQIEGIDSGRLRGFVVKAVSVVAELADSVPSMRGGRRKIKAAAVPAKPPLFPADAVLTIGGQSFPVALAPVSRPEWTCWADDRLEVVGFEIHIDDAAQAAVAEAYVDTARSVPVRLDLRDLGIGVYSINPPGAVERVADFCLAGWIAQPDVSPASFALTANGRLVDAAVVLGKRWKFAADCLINDRQRDEAASPVTFRLELPPTIWLNAEQASGVDLQLSCNGSVLLLGRVGLTRAGAAILAESNLLATPVPASRDLVIDHVLAGKLVDLLREPARVVFAQALLTRQQEIFVALAAEPEHVGGGDDAQAADEGVVIAELVVEQVAAEEAVETVLVEVVRMEISPARDFDVSLDLVAANDDIVMHLKARRDRCCLLHNRKIGDVWGEERVLGYLPSDWRRTLIDLEIGVSDVSVLVNGELWAVLDASDLGSGEITVRGGSARFRRRRPVDRVPADLPLTGGAKSVGVVEKCVGGHIAGWAAASATALSFELDLGDGPIPLSPVWTVNPRFAAASGASATHASFALTVPKNMQPALQVALDAWNRSVWNQAALGEIKPQLSVGGKIVDWLKPLPAAMVDQMNGFTLEGEITTEATTPPAVNVQFARKNVDVAVIQWLKSSVPLSGMAQSKLTKGAVIAKNAAKADEVLRLYTYGFEFDVPGTVWLNLTEDEIALDVSVDGVGLPSTGMVLTRDHAMQTFNSVARVGDDTPDRRRAALLALEHVAFGRFLQTMGADVVDYFRSLAERMRLADFLRRDVAGDEAAEDVPISLAAVAAPARESMDRIVVWRALRKLSGRIKGRSAIFSDVRAIIDEWDLAGKRREDFCLTLIPELCRTNELHKLKEVLPHVTTLYSENSDEAWQLNIAAAFLVTEREIGRAAEVLYRMAGRMQVQGWFDTDHMAYAMRMVEQMAEQRGVPEADVQRFRYAVLAVMDALKGAWFSRLHDRQMVETMVLLLGRNHLVPAYLAQDLSRAALKHYGLSPDFWRLWAAASLKIGVSPHHLLLRGQFHFENLAAAIDTPDGVDAALFEVNEALRFFQTHKNPEALYWMREIAAHALRAGSGAAASDVKILLANILSVEVSDVVRVATMPVPASSGRALQVEQQEAIPRIVQGLQKTVSSSSFETQYEFCRMMAQQGPVTRERSASLLAMVDVLACSRSWFLGVDLTALLAVKCGDAGGQWAAVLNHEALLMRFEYLLRQFITVEQHWNHLPAPICAGLSRLKFLGRRERDLYFNELQRTLDVVVEERFGTLHDAALAIVADPKIEIDDQSVHGDTLVVVYSCNAYLDTRIPAIRETWMQDLRVRGIPCIVMVGGGDDTLDGDVLRLAVSDAYDDLPAKTIALIKWVVENTNARYLIKIDDDCYLSAANYFNTLEYRSHHYYGRLLERKVGGMDRTWHHKKAPGIAKRIDLSPEPSIYADGGGVYCLSRFAMTQVLENAKTARGQRLRADSFMEDKLVGDLLSMSGIRVDNTDYGSYQRRRTFAEALPVAMWEDSFFPSALSPTKVVHLDSHLDQARAHALRDRLELSPKKLWPSFQKIEIDIWDPQLELLSSLDAVEQAMLDPLSVVCVVRNEMTMLPHFLAHYRGLGVRSFFFVDNLSDDGTREYLFAQPDVVLYSAAQEYRFSHFGVSWQQAVLSHHFLGRWALVADADELLIFPNWRDRSLASLLDEVQAEGADAVALCMVDMYPFGSLEDADFEKQSPFEAAPWFDAVPVQPEGFAKCYYSSRPQLVSSLRHRLMPDSEPASFVAEKIALFKYHPWLRVSEGLHGAGNVKVASVRATFAHFKYHAGFRKKVLVEIGRNQHFRNAVEYRRYAAVLAESFGDFGVEGISVQLGPDGFTPSV